MADDHHQEQCETLPGWAKEIHTTVLNEVTAMLRPITGGMEELRVEFNQMKLQVGIVQADAEDATMQSGLAHGAAEEAANLVHALDERVKAIKASMATMMEVKNLIDGALHQSRTIGRGAALGETGHSQASQDKADKHSRTAVIGGFDMDTMKSEVEAKVSEITHDIGGVEEVYAYRRGSVGFARFTTTDAMWKFLKTFNDKERAKPIHNGKHMWASPSRSPDDRRKPRIFGTHKNVLVEVGLADFSQIDYDLRRGILRAGRERIGEWTGDSASGDLVLNQDALVKAGLNVQVKMLSDAVTDALRK